jgi:hypothetical protein
MRVVMDDGEELDYGPGDFAIMPPGHDAWVVGDEDCVFVDWQAGRSSSTWMADRWGAPPEGPDLGRQQRLHPGVDQREDRSGDEQPTIGRRR